MMTMKGLAKLVEECGELTQVAAKKMARMETDQHWDGSGSLNARMEDEMADVRAAIAFVTETFGLNEDAIEFRATRKLHIFREWHEQANDAPVEAR